METVNIIANLACAASLLACGVYLLYVIRSLFSDVHKAKTFRRRAVAWVASILTVVLFTSMAVQAASSWDSSRISQECPK